MKVKRLMASLLCGAIGAATLGLSGCGSAADSGMMDAANANAVAGGSSDLPVVTWKMGSTWGDGNIHFTCDERFSELVSQLTDGRFTITNYPEGSLCAANQLFDYVQNGTIQCGGDWGGYWSGKDTAFELLSTTMDNFTGMDYYILDRGDRPGRADAGLSVVDHDREVGHVVLAVHILIALKAAALRDPGRSPRSRICRA